ncbi:type II secretion system protein GspM [Undibacterium sp. 5I1]|uniref:type II secretion system protein GspM n=1 Tax=unclassified Undibacterium TaxID=2630295 RepID=UPI002AB41F4E|nr:MULTISPECIES: type II secretion system protein GspM [unclassified Undibacterium]MDY7538060.1 type II secretion system protein GspM [Undibacterium sp. 5I1]MEB0231653.1 type II secretion system protein GspM [Undibacterium sp. 10I3]MEB0258664.1 type II secretion system protein GspM [Undibacterium sp. 5I1]
MKNSMLVESLSLFWQQRVPRERWMLSLALLAIVCALIYVIGINPALSGKQSLQKAIPQLRQQVAEMDLMSKQSAQLGNAMSENIDTVSRESIETSLARRSIKAQNLSVNDDVVRFQIATVAYANLMEWLLEAQKSTRLTVEEAKLAALPESGQVSVTITLKQQKNNL